MNNAALPADISAEQDSGFRLPGTSPNDLLPILALIASFPYTRDAFKYLILAALLEFGRRSWAWVVHRIRFRPHITATFIMGDPSYEWLMHFLMEKKLWQNTRMFDVSAKTSRHKWAVTTSEMLRPQSAHKSGNEMKWLASFVGGKNNVERPGDIGEKEEQPSDQMADYVPQWIDPHVLTWNGYLIDVCRTAGVPGNFPGQEGIPSQLRVTFFTRDTSVLPKFVQAAREHYLATHEESRRVIVHLPSPSSRYGPYRSTEWASRKNKPLRPLNTVSLEEGVMEDLVRDVREFLGLESWYNLHGIPHRRGYLLHGPPGTGKTSTIYALAGELGLEIYSASLSGQGMDDDYLQRLAESVPRRNIFLVEDIDCAFPSREELEDPFYSPFSPPGTPGKGTVTMSGLLNVLDGVGSDEGRIFFATTNYPSRLDPALLRPGRIDRQIEYKHASALQTGAMFDHFFPPAQYKILEQSDSDSDPKSGTPWGTFESKFHPPISLSRSLPVIREEFIASIPPNEFTTAELQGFLLIHKWEPERTVGDTVKTWVEKTRLEKKERKEQDQRLSAVRLNKRKSQWIEQLEWQKEWEDTKDVKKPGSDSDGKSDSEGKGSKSDRKLVGSLEFLANLM